MSKISTIHDAIVTLVSTNLSTYDQLPNPYRPELNNELYLQKGFGVAVGAGQRTDRLISCQLSWERIFQIVLTKQITTTAQNLSQLETISKDLLEDHFTILDALEKDTTLTQTAINSRIISDAGIEFLEIEDSTGRYFVMVIDVLAEYLEDLN